MFPGTKFTIGNQEYTVPPLSLGQLRNGVLDLMKQHDELISQNKTWESLELRGKIIHQALSRNYPDIGEDELFSQLDMGNTNPIWLAVLGASGLGGGQSSDPEGRAGAGDGTSSPSTVPSPLPTDGPTPKLTSTP